MIRKTIFLFGLFLFMSLLSEASEFKILDFYKNESDLAARRYERTDINDQKCALIKVRTDLEGLKFNTNMGVVGDIERKEGDYWVYVSPNEQRIKFIKEGYISKTFSFPASIQSSAVYVLELTGTGQGEILGKDLVKTTFRMNTSGVYISKNNAAPTQATGEVAEYQLPKGSYTFTFSKEGYQDITRKITVEEEKVLDITLEEGRQESSFKLPGIITITSKPEGADVLLNNQKVGVTPFKDEIIAGQYDLTLKKDLYHTYNASFTLKEGKTKELPDIEITPKFGYIAITADPQQAEIFLDGKSLGTAPVSRRKIESGKHTLRAEYALYHTKTKEITIEDGDDKAISLTLDPAFGSLKVESEPKGADVFLDGEKVGTTPYADEKIASGVYELRVTKKLWNEETEQVIIQDEQATEKMEVLTQNFGKVKVDAGEAAIYQNGNKVATGSYEAKLKPGTYTFRATKPKHTPDEKEVYLSVGDNRQITLKPQPQQGSLSVFAEPDKARNAQIYINGERHKKTTPAVIPLLYGEYTVTLKKEGFLDQTKNISIEANKSRKVTFEMQTYQGSLQHDFKKHKTAKILWGTTAVLFGGAGTYFKFAADGHYDDYQAATSTAKATDLHDKVERADQYKLIGWGVAGAALVPAIIQAVKQGKVKNKMQVSARPVDKGAVLSVKWKF
ncbi:MAG: PEGA domain-containing protein [Bacteroidales bacterium]|nr:PEGA domain-containing protein [Bacteroidales bacterium]